MICKTYGDTLVVRLEKGEEILTGLLQACKQEGITLASVTGIGAVEQATLGFYDLKQGKYLSREYTAGYEITSLVGNVTTMNGEPALHLHMTIAGEDGVVYGGHLSQGVISVTGEIVLQKIPGTVEKRPDPVLGLNLMDLQ